jgi:hypothetical protein
MSGGGGVGGGGGVAPGWPPSDPGTKCDELSFQTKLASPDPKVVANLIQNDILDIKLQNGIIVAVHHTGVAGSIIENIPALLRCLQLNNKYKGLIIGISGGMVDVEVIPT